VGGKVYIEKQNVMAAKSIMQKYQEMVSMKSLTLKLCLALRLTLSHYNAENTNLAWACKINPHGRLLSPILIKSLQLITGNVPEMSSGECISTNIVNVRA
jgi:hypothetical protein